VANTALSSACQNIPQRMLQCRHADCVECAPQDDQRTPEKSYLHSEYDHDFLPTGKDNVICLRYGLQGDYRLMVYDDGNCRAGKELIKHIREHYGTNVVDDLICSHPDVNQEDGVAMILQEMEVRNLWMNRPWAHSALSSRYFGSGSIADISHATHLKEKMAAAYGLEKLALKRGVRLAEPFQGTRIGPFTVLSPHYDWYMHSLIPAFKNSRPVKRPIGPEVEFLLRQSGICIDNPDDDRREGDVEKQMANPTNKHFPPLSKSDELETLQGNDETSAENESSVILFGLIAGQGVLLTGNAGVKALSATIGYADSKLASAIPRESTQAEKIMPEACMSVVDHASESWFLLSDNHGYYLEVYCALSHSRVNFWLLIKLKKNERLDYHIMGVSFIRKLAQEVQRSPTIYYRRNQSIQMQKLASSAINKWLALS
jgi:hypothetical protein